MMLRRKLIGTATAAVLAGTLGMAPAAMAAPAPTAAPGAFAAAQPAATTQEVTGTLADGTAYTGLLTVDSSAGVTIKTLDDADHVLPRANLKSLASTNHSLMPQGFEAALTADDLGDLMAFIHHPVAAK